MKTYRKTFPLWLKCLSRMLTNWPHWAQAKPTSPPVTQWEAKHPRFVIMGLVRVMIFEWLVPLDRKTLDIHMFQRYVVIIGNFC